MTIDTGQGCPERIGYIQKCGGDGPETGEEEGNGVRTECSRGFK